MNPFLPLALSLAPELSAALFGPGAEAATQAMEQAVRQATGTPDPAAAQQVVARDARVASALRVALAGIAADAARAARVAELSGLAAGAGTKTPAEATPTAATWAPALVSSLVLVAFAAAVCAALTRSLPAGSETVVTMLLGTLAAMATSVVSYWVGSSAGSALKTDLLFRARAQPSGASPAGPVAQPAGS